MLDEMHIYIPTLARWDKQITLKSIPKNWLKKTHLLVDKNEIKEYKKRHDIDIITVPELGAAHARQAAIDNAHGKYVLMIDDDMDFSVRKEKGSIKLTRCSEKDMIDMFSLLYGWLEKGIVHVGISQRGGNNYVLEDFKENTRMFNVYGYNVEVFRKAGVKFRLSGMEDFDMTLTLLELGFSNRVSFKYCGNMKSGAPGGASVYRTLKFQKEVAHELYRLHPNLVRIVPKTSKSTWKTLDSDKHDITRIDVNILWNKIKLCTAPNLSKWGKK